MLNNKVILVERNRKTAAQFHYVIITVTDVCSQIFHYIFYFIFIYIIST
jgi:hypothetical protein